jgi:hypothetical protein
LCAFLISSPISSSFNLIIKSIWWREQIIKPLIM